MNTSDLLLERAKLLLEQGRVEDAIKNLKDALHEDPDNAEAMAVYARCYFQKRKFTEGMQLLQQAIRLDPQNSYYFYLLGFAHYRNNDNKVATAHLYRAIQLNPYGAEYYGLLAFVYLEEKEFETALAKADEGLAIDAENITCLNARSTAQNKLRRTDEAIATMENALAKDPDNEFTHATIGWNFLEKGKHKRATTHFREALRIAPNNHSAKAGLKEALKSKIPPYRWLLQFNFWIRNKGSRFRWIFIIAVLVGVRIIKELGDANKNFEGIALVVVGAYILFVATSWIINPLANLFLLFHKDGKHALDSSEKWNAIGFLFCIFSGIVTLCLSSIVMDKEQSGWVMGSGLMLLTLCVPVGHMKFPIRFKRNSFSQWLAIVMILLSCLSVIASITAWFEPVPVFVIYFASFVIYSWSSSS